MAEYVASREYKDETGDGAIEVCLNYLSGDNCFAEITVVEDGEEAGILLNNNDIEWLIRALRKAQTLYKARLG